MGKVLQHGRPLSYHARRWTRQLNFTYTSRLLNEVRDVANGRIYLTRTIRLLVNKGAYSEMFEKEQNSKPEFQLRQSDSEVLA